MTSCVAPDGRETKYDIIEHAGSVVMVPIDEHGNLLFVRQYRPAAGTDLLELPAGTLDENESFEACAAREMREETGMAADRLEKVGEFFLVPGYSTEFMAVFVATGLRPDPLPERCGRIPGAGAVPGEGGSPIWPRAGKFRMPSRLRHC